MVLGLVHPAEDRVILFQYQCYPSGLGVPSLGCNLKFPYFFLYGPHAAMNSNITECNTEENSWWQ